MAHLASEEILDPSLPLVFDSRVSTSWFSRASRSFFGDRASEKGLWYPPAVRKFSMPTAGAYAHGFPQGAVVHATDGRSKNGDRDAENTIPDGISKGFCYFCISSVGTVYQSFLLDRWGWHCGATQYSGLSDLNNKFVGIELCSAGIVKKHATYYRPEDFDERFTEAEVRHTDKVENVTEAGHYVRFTDKQEEALIKLLLWMHETKPDVFKLENVVGHDETAIRPVGRKNDPGGALSSYMRPFRQKLLAMAATS